MSVLPNCADVQTLKRQVEADIHAEDMVIIFLHAEGHHSWQFTVSEALVKAVIYAIDRGAFGNLCVFASVGEAVSWNVSSRLGTEKFFSNRSFQRSM